MKTEIFLAFRYLFRGKAHHLSFIGIISCLGVMVGVATLIVVISVMNGFDQELMETLMRFNYHITVETSDRDISDSTVNKIRNIDGVESAGKFIQTQVFAKFDSYIVPVVVRGMDFNNPNEKNMFDKYILTQEDGDGFYVGYGLRDKFLLDKKIEYYPLVKKLRAKEENIKGVFKVGLYEFDNSFIICDLEKARSLSDNYLLGIGLKINDPLAAQKIKEKIKQSNPNLMVSTWIETNQTLFSALELEKLVMFIILSLIILVATFNIFATLTVKVVEKTKDIGILKSLGFNSRKILSIFCMQGILLGVIGVFMGVALGGGICFLVEEYEIIKIPQQIYYIDHLPVAFNFNDIALISIIGIFLSFVASLIPAIRASRLKPCEALRYE